MIRQGETEKAEPQTGRNDCPTTGRNACATEAGAEPKTGKNACPTRQKWLRNCPTEMKLASLPILALMLLLAGGLVAAQATREVGPAALPTDATRPATSASADAQGPVRFGAV